MAQAPTAEQTAFPEQGPLPQANAADFGGQIGAATEGVGQNIGQASDVMAQQLLKWQGLKNEATASDLDVQFQGDLGKLEDGYYSLKGKAQADAYPQFQSDLTSLRQKYIGASPNPMVANMLQQSVGYSIGRSLRSAGQTAGEATRSWMIDAQQSRFESLGYNAVKRASDQGYADESNTARDASIDSLGEAQGWSPEHIALAKEQARDDLLAKRQQAALAAAKAAPVADVMRALVGGGTSGPPGEVGGQAYKSALVATEFGSGQDTPGNPHKGPVQADDAWLAHFGSGKPRDQMTMQDWMDATDKETAENKPKLQAALGRPVTDADLYLAHQQGEAGAEALLKNPDKLAKDVVDPANLAKNVPAGIDPNIMTAGQFSNIWSKGFDQTGGIMASNPASRNNQLDATIAVLSDAQKMELTKSTIDAWHTQDTAFREQTKFQQEQQAKVEKQQYDDVKTQGQAAIAANWAEPQKNPPLDIAKFSQTPYAQQHPELVTAMIDYRKALANPPDSGVDKQTTAQLYRGYLDGTATTKDFQEAFAPADGSPGKISKDNLDFLMNAAKGKDDPNAEAQKALKSKFISDNDQNIGLAGNAIDPDSEYRFNFNFEQAWADKVAKGENPKDLITPGNKDYFGTPANLSLYSHTAADQLQAERDAQTPGLLSRVWTSLTGSNQTAGPVIPPELPKGTTYGGKLKDGRDAYRLPDGTLRALAAPQAAAAAPAPVAANTGLGPAPVPTGP